MLFPPVPYAALSFDSVSWDNSIKTQLESFVFYVVNMTSPNLNDDVGRLICEHLTSKDIKQLRLVRESFYPWATQCLFHRIRLSADEAIFATFFSVCQQKHHAQHVKTLAISLDMFATPQTVEFKQTMLISSRALANGHIFQAEIDRRSKIPRAIWQLSTAYLKLRNLHNVVVVFEPGEYNEKAVWNHVGTSTLLCLLLGPFSFIWHGLRSITIRRANRPFSPLSFEVFSRVLQFLTLERPFGHRSLRDPGKALAVDLSHPLVGFFSSIRDLKLFLSPRSNLEPANLQLGWLTPALHKMSLTLIKLDIDVENIERCHIPIVNNGHRIVQCPFMLARCYLHTAEAYRPPWSLFGLNKSWPQLRSLALKNISWSMEDVKTFLTDERTANIETIDLNNWSCSPWDQRHPLPTREDLEDLASSVGRSGLRQVMLEQSFSSSGFICSEQVSRSHVHRPRRLHSHQYFRTNFEKLHYLLSDMGLSRSVAFDHLVYDVPMSTRTGQIPIFELEKWCNSAATEHIKAKARLEILSLDAEERLVCSQRQDVDETSMSPRDFCCHQHLIEHHRTAALSAACNEERRRILLRRPPRQAEASTRSQSTSTE